MILRLLKTDTLYTSIGKPIVNGMLAIDQNNRIAKVGTNLFFSGVDIEYFPGALCAGFVNAHCHLELSHLKGKVSKQKGLDGFIQELQSIRKASEEEVEAAIIKADMQLKKEGIVAVGDISNGISTFEIKQRSSIYYHTFIELFGFDPNRANEIIKESNSVTKLATEKQLSNSIVPHSPYSVSKALFNLILSEPNNVPLSIHNQEANSENELFQDGGGKMARMLNKFGVDTSTFEVSGQNSLPSYLSLFPKETSLLLVHNTYTSAEDISFAEANHSKLFWCFCPKANLYIENRLPNLPVFLEKAVCCTLGTDSLASNDTLSIWEEIRTIQQHFPEIDLNDILKWATINGATFLGIDEIFGSLEIGKVAKINWIKNETSTITPLF